MKQNVGTMDKAGRAFLAATLFGIGWKKQGKLSVLAGFVAGMLSSSVASGFCPLYKLAGISTAEDAGESCCQEC
jgi:Na+/proline symporter